MYACLASLPPQRSDERAKKDNLETAVRRWQGRYSEQLLQTIDWCLKLDPNERPQSVYALQKALARRVRHTRSRRTVYYWIGNLGKKLRSMITRT